MRRGLKAVVGLLALGGLVVLLALMMSRHEAPAPGEGDAGRGEWVIKGLHHTSTFGDERFLMVAADEVRLSRVRLGFFRVGFVWELVCRNVSIEVRRDPALPVGGRPEGRAGWDAAKTRRELTIAGVRVEGFRARLLDRQGEWVELRADRCESSLVRGGRIACRGGVEVRNQTGDRIFRRLEYDPGARRFLAVDETRPGGAPAPAVSTGAILDELSTAVGSLGDLRTEALHAYVRALLIR